MDAESKAKQQASFSEIAAEVIADGDNTNSDAYTRYNYHTIGQGVNPELLNSMLHLPPTTPTAWQPSASEWQAAHSIAKIAWSEAQADFTKRMQQYRQEFANWEKEVTARKTTYAKAQKNTGAFTKLLSFFGQTSAPIPKLELPIEPLKPQLTAFKISRKANAFSKDHSIIVIPADNAKGYKIGILARGKIYNKSSVNSQSPTVSVVEGIVGRGGINVARLLLLEDGQYCVAKTRRIILENVTNKMLHFSDSELKTWLQYWQMKKESIHHFRRLDKIMRIVGLKITDFARVKLWARHDAAGDEITEGFVTTVTVESLITGNNLAELLQLTAKQLTEQPFSTAILTILNFSLAAANGVAALHEKNIVHNDIKPSNIIYDLATNTTQLIDFDTAYLLEDTELRADHLQPVINASAQLIGVKNTEDIDATPEFEPPEHARKWYKGFVTKPGDVYALSKTLNEIRQQLGLTEQKLILLKQQDPALYEAFYPFIALTTQIEALIPQADQIKSEQALIALLEQRPTAAAISKLLLNIQQQVQQLLQQRQQQTLTIAPNSASPTPTDQSPFSRSSTPSSKLLSSDLATPEPSIF